MKGKAYCSKCKKNMEIKKIYICGTAISVYLQCNHHFHLNVKGTIVEE
jgi:hypothetical protein